MTTDLETRLSAHYRDVADQLVLPDVIFDDVLARSTDTRVAETTDRLVDRDQPPVARWLAIAAAVLLFVVGLASIVRRGDDPGSTLIDRPSTLLSNVDEIAADEWVIAGPLPAGVVWMYADWTYAIGIETNAPAWRSATYGNERESGTFERLHISIGRPPVAGQIIAIAGAEWSVDTPASGPWSASRTVGETTVSVSDSGPFDQEDRDLIAGLVVVPTDQLPFPPLGNRADGVEVATFDLDGVAQSFVVQESNGHWCTWIVSSDGESGGCGGTVDASAAVTIQSGYSTVAEGADTAEMISAGIASADSARVEVEFGDGTVVNVLPTDLSGRFDRTFWIAGAVVAADGRSVRVRSYDADGELLGTQVG